MGWLVFALFASAFAALSALGGVIAVFTANWFGVVQAPIAVLAGFWFTAGAWRRTDWGRPEPGDGPRDPPVLTPARARRYTTGGLACVIAAAVALGVQMIQARG